jgi:phenylalanyl-tRNA synthetase beta subunit
VNRTDHDTDKTFFKGRAASIHVNVKIDDKLKNFVIGEFGVIHPTVLKNFDIQ